MAKIIAFSGSARTESFNKKLIAQAADYARAEGADVTLVDLRDYTMPLYDGDLEASEGIPDAANKLYELMKENDGLLLACPEYNSSITPLLKNTIDWISRPRPNEPPLAAYSGKVATLLAASPGALGGLRGLVHVRSILGNIGVIVLPNQVAIGVAHEAFDADGRLRDEKKTQQVKAAVKDLVSATEKMSK